MKKQIIDYISKGYKIKLNLSDGNTMIFSNIVNETEDDNAIEVDNGDNTIKHVINLRYVVYITPLEETKRQRISF
ncbi:TPA: hypothetical protein U1D11_000676 [Streptococcus suis]|nr:hypothetical protein [Streptococcus suis]